MSLTRLLAVTLMICAFARPTLAKGDKAKDDADAAAATEDESTDDAASDDSAADSGDEDEAQPKKKKDKKKSDGGDEAPKQDLSGHDLGTQKKENTFEKDRFFVDKVDTAKTAKGTLIQGSLASSTFAFTELGGDYSPTTGSDAARFSRYFTDLRLQTDFRHLSGGRWDARIDARARVVSTPPDCDGCAMNASADPNHIQSGFKGTNEYDLRELWLFRSGKRSDLFFGRQFIPDLGAIKFDGLRVDYASSSKFTMIGFGGLYPVRGSRSITTDYQPLKDNELATAGRFVGAGGFGAAYRTLNSYGSIGGVALVPFKGELPRIFATSSGYLRNGATLDLYHFALVDLVSSAGAGITNLSAGFNYKPNPRLRVTGSFNRVDVDTLNVQANAFLNPADNAGVGATTIQNETFFRRLSTNAGRFGVSAGLGPLQRFEVSTAATVRYRPAVTLTGPPVMGMKAQELTLSPTKGADIFFSFIDRRSIKDMRLGLDGSRSFAIGTVAFERNEVLAVRAFGARELTSGKGEWEGEIGYATTKDKTTGVVCDGTNATIGSQCFGSSTGSILSIGGQLYYRFSRDWYSITNLYISRQSTTHVAPVKGSDPAVTGLMGFFRIAYRF
jgi:hypothetical protein